MANMKELVDEAKASLAESQTRGKYVEPKKPTKEETESTLMRQTLEKNGAISALEELRDLTGDPKAKVEVFREDSYSPHAYGKKFTPRMVARLVWGEHEGEEVLEKRAEKVIKKKVKDLIYIQETSDVTYAKLRPLESRSVEVEVRMNPDDKYNPDYVAGSGSWGGNVPGNLAYDFAKGGKKIETGRKQTGTVTKREERTHEKEIDFGPQF